MKKINGYLSFKRNSSSLSASDVRTETFQTSNAQGKAIATREFEGLTFDRTGAGYLLTNKGVEIMKATSSDF